MGLGNVWCTLYSETGSQQKDYILEMTGSFQLSETR